MSFRKNENILRIKKIQQNVKFFRENTENIISCTVKRQLQSMRINSFETQWEW